ncbi:MAG: 5-methyltetrahydropteroyltriglutamate--homocysteine methyltransferase [Paracoccaceae bacterium]|jgi:5-methyltetrahydropteroyltriglutamate--homocysteine methyltransferase
MIPTTIAGSLPKPDWLAEPEQLWAPWKLQGDALIDGQQKAAREWIEFQEQAGIDIVSDGEQFRKHFVHGFLEEIDGIDWQLMTTMGIRNDRYDAQVPTVTSAVKRKGSVHGASTKFCRSVATGGLKMTLPGPMTICDTIADKHYGDRPAMAMAFADLLNEEARELQAIGVDTIQFDEPAFNAFTQEAGTWGVEALHRAIDGLTCKTAVHICYGYGIKANDDWKKSLGSEWRQYEDFFPALNASRIDQVSLECANSRVPMSLIGLLKDKEVLVGAIDVASQQVETPEQVAATLREAMQYIDAEQILACTNCGLAPLPMDISRAKIQALGAGARLLRAELAG